MKKIAQIASLLAVLMAAGCAFEPTGFAGSEDGGADGLDATSPSDAANSAIRDATGDAGETNASDATATDGARDAADPDAADASDAANATDAEADADMPPSNVCDGQVVDLDRSNRHCGVCGNACDELYGQCRGGDCACIDPYSACGPENECTDLLVDPANCGFCGKECSTAQFCDAGACRCLPGLTLCGGDCVDLQNDPNHCGDCNESCGTNSCKDGACRTNDRCGPLVLECRVAGGGTACVDDNESPLSCNARILDPCGEVCDGDELCYRSSIIEPRSCRTYRPARGCVDCPCADCSDNGEECEVLDAFPGKPVCID